MVCTSTALLYLNLTPKTFQSTNSYWNSWIRKSTYQRSWKEAVHRSALALKLLIYEPTGRFSQRFATSFLTLWNLGAVVASPTFSLPEYIGGTRNWYVRDYLTAADSTRHVLIGIIGSLLIGNIIVSG